MMIPWFQWLTIMVGPITLQVWGLFVAIGLVVASVIISKRAKRLGYNPEIFLDLVIWMMIVGVVFSRVFHVVFYDIGFYLADPLEVLKLWNGGLSSFGGIFGAGLGMWFYLKKKKIGSDKFVPYLDVLSFGALYGWIVGRLGCFFIHDHLGKEGTGLLFIDTPNGPRYEMALLEIIGLIPLAILFFFFRKKKLPAGWFLFVLIVYYGFLRFILDFWRVDTKYLGLTPAQYFGMVLVALGIFIFSRFRKE